MVILVAEDMDDTRQMMKLLLELDGHEVETAANGLQAVRAATQHVPDVILMDLCMPGMDGFEATRTLRGIPETHGVPIIAVSAYAGDNEWCDKALNVGVNECLGKPVDFAALKFALCRYTSPEVGVMA